MEEYPLVRNRRARARDFYDIYAIVEATRLDLGSAQCRALAGNVFAAKDVPLALTSHIHETREFHRPDWPSVIASVSENLESFDYYFDWLCREAVKLEPGRDE
jgi:hypothetical protein